MIMFKSVALSAMAAILAASAIVGSAQALPAVQYQDGDRGTETASDSGNEVARGFFQDFHRSAESSGLGDVSPELQVVDPNE
jgi:hypothetical protein